MLVLMHTQAPSNQNQIEIIVAFRQNKGREAFSLENKLFLWIIALSAILLIVLIILVFMCVKQRSHRVVHVR